MYLNIFGRKLCMYPLITTQELGLAGSGVGRGEEHKRL